MSSFGKTSTKRLLTCDTSIQQVAQIVIQHYDFSVLCGHRNERDQQEAFNASPQRSKVEYPNSKHNVYPSLAIDIAPWPVDWEDLSRFYYLAGLWIATGLSLGIEFRWGGDFNHDLNFKNDKFIDMPHMERIITQERSSK